MMMEIMNTFPINTTISRTEVSQGRLQVRVNPSLEVRDRTVVYWMAENLAPMMEAMKNKILIKQQITARPPPWRRNGTDPQLAYVKPPPIYLEQRIPRR